MNPRHPGYAADLNEILRAVPDWEQLRGASILVTGATGLIGAMLTDALLYASRKLDLRLRVFGLSRNPEKYAGRFDGAQRIACDLASA